MLGRAQRQNKLMTRALWIAAAAASLTLSSRCSSSSSGSKPGSHAEARAFTLNREVAKVDLKEFTIEPHPMGSPRQAQIADYLEKRAGELGMAMKRDRFTATVPNPKALGGAPVNPTMELAGTNLLMFTGTSKDCVIALGSHYDSKYFEDFRYVGANDSGSSSVLLLQLLAVLKNVTGAQCDFVAIWFDGEEAYLRDWDDGERLHPAKIKDNTYGSRHLADALTRCPKEGFCLPEALGGKRLLALILLDMIGSPGMRITLDSFSTPKLTRMLEENAAALGLAGILGRVQPIADDHIPFLNRGVPAIDLIDFHNLNVWHRPGDEPEQVSMESIEIAGKLAISLAVVLANNPQVFQ
jgi:glutaminyl-peptide cyclotransferase